MVGLVRDLGMGEPQNSEAGGNQRLVPGPIPSLLLWRSVVSQPIGLDDQPELRPMEVHPETLHSLLGFRFGQPRAPNESQEPPFELGVRQGERASIELRRSDLTPAIPLWSDTASRSASGSISASLSARFTAASSGPG